MDEKLPNLSSPSDWERLQACALSPPRGRLKLLPPSRQIFEVFPLAQGRGLRLIGDLCFSTVGDLVAMLDTLPARAGVLDLFDLSFMDSSGLHALEEYASGLESGPLVLLNPPACVQRLFELTGADLNPHIELRSDGDRG
jgi:anti-anti-sigma factor